VPDFTHVNYLAVIIGVVVMLVIGYVWYMPMVLGKRYEAATGKALGSPTPMTIGYQVVAGLLVSYGLALLFGGVGLTNGAIWGALMWLYFVVPVSAAAVFYEGRSWMWWGITAGYWLVSMLVVGGVVGMMNATM
jgi:hypothetical protein